MTQLRSAFGPLLVVVLLATVALAGCSDDGDADDDAADGTTTTSAGEADTVGTGTDGATSDASGDDTVVPADQVGTPICEALTSDVVGDAIGLEVTGTDGYGLGTPQCSYSFEDEGVVTTVSVAVPRPDEDLGGLTGEEALDYSVELNESAIPDAEASETDVDGADAAVLIESEVVLNLLILVDDQILTVASPALDPDQLAALGAAAVVALAA
jgi:hypothetical protein